MDKLNPLSPNSYPSGLSAGMAQAVPTPPKPLTHEDRIQRLEQQMQRLQDELNAVAESHANQLTQLQLRVG